MATAKKSRPKPAPEPKPAEGEPQTATVEWEGIAIEVSYVTHYLGLPRHCHLELHVESKELLPVTDTGYRSEFLPPGAVERAGGPAAYVLAWLTEAAKNPVWRKQRDAARQLDLFG